MDSNPLHRYEIVITILSTLGATGVLWFLIKQTRRLVQVHGKTLISGAFWVLERALTRSISASLSMKRYCITQLANDSGRFLQVPGSGNLALDVDSVFVPLTLQLGGRNKTFNSSNFLDAGSRLIVVGDPGCGKSTLIKRVFRDSCVRASGHPAKERLPIRLELKSLTPSQEIKGETSAGEWLMALLREAVNKVEGFEMGRLFDSWSTDAGLLVLLDGRDEVSSENYPVVAMAIRELSRRLADLTPNNVVVLTMRIQFHQQVGYEFEEDYPQTMYVRQFLPNEIFTFLNRWPFDDDQDAEGSINRIYAELIDRPTLREMCSNPLVLAMYVENDYRSGGDDAPDTRTQFYEKVVTELLIKRRRRQDLVVGRTVGLREQREEILGELALENLLDPNQPANLLSWDKAISITQRVCKCSISDAEAILRELARETGLISEERPGESIRFIHLTFCEFLAANQCAKGRQKGWEAMLDTHREFVMSGESQLQTRLVEVLPFAHALLPRIQRNEALSDVANLDDPLVLGRCFLETQLYGQPEWPDYLRKERQYLTGTMQDGWTESKIRRLHLFSVIVGDAREWHAGVARVKFVPELESVFTDIVRGNREVLARVFATYASQDAAAAVRLAEQVGIDMLAEQPNLLVQSCQEEPFLAYALAGIKTSSISSWAAILVEAALLYSNVAYRLAVLIPPANAPLSGVNPKYRKLLRLSAIGIGSWYEALLSTVLDCNDIDERLTAIGLMKECTRRASFHRLIYFFRVLLGVGVATSSLVIFFSVTNFAPKEFQIYLVVLTTALSCVLGISFYSLAYEIRQIYLAIFDFVEIIGDEPMEVFAARTILSSKVIRNSFLVVQTSALVQITALRGAEPYLTLRHFFPSKLIAKADRQQPTHR